MTRGARVLVVEDDELQLEMIREWLTHRGFAVTAARGGAVGLVAVAGRTFDVVVTDLQMPGVTGLDIIERVRARSLTTPIVVLSGQASARDLGAALAGDPAVHFVQKPLSRLDQLTQAIERALGRA